MAKKTKTIISSPDTNDLEKLYDIYLADNEKASYDDFIQFLSIESVERSLFLDANCITEPVDMDSTIILKVSLKA